MRCVFIKIYYESSEKGYCALVKTGPNYYTGLTCYDRDMEEEGFDPPKFVDKIALLRAGKNQKDA